jgi:hypothetical protein
MVKKYRSRKAISGSVPGGVEHGVIGGPDGAVILDVFSPPRDEYMRPGSGFGVE